MKNLLLIAQLSNLCILYEKTDIFIASHILTIFKKKNNSKRFNASRYSYERLTARFYC